MEAAGILSPVLDAYAEYKTMTRYGETVDIDIAIESYNGIKLGIVYTVRDQASGEVRCIGKTHHCFLDREGRPVFLKKNRPQWHAILNTCAVTHGTAAKGWNV